MANQSLVRHHKSPRERARILAAYARGLQTQEAVAAQHGIAVSTLQRWLRQSGADRPVGASELIEIPNLLGGGATGSAYRVRFARGLVLEVASGFEPGEVRALAAALQSL